jgi:alpha-ketoglutarate-dependent taurine dioxygenase
MIDLSDISQQGRRLQLVVLLRALVLAQAPDFALASIMGRVCYYWFLGAAAWQHPVPCTYALCAAQAHYSCG